MERYLHGYFKSNEEVENSGEIVDFGNFDEAQYENKAYVEEENPENVVNFPVKKIEIVDYFKEIKEKFENMVQLRPELLSMMSSIQLRAQQLHAACGPGEFSAKDLLSGSVTVSFMNVGEMVKNLFEHKHCKECEGDIDFLGYCKKCRKKAA